MNPSIDSQIATALVEEFLRSWVESGHYDPTGKTTKEIFEEFLPILSKSLDKSPILVTEDHRSYLLTKARDAKNNRQHEIACLFYATWFEHTINAAIDRLLTRKNLPKEDISLVIRDSSLRAKAFVLLPLLRFTKMQPKHLKILFRICELRNAFVHYKFQCADIDSWTKRNNQWNSDLECADKAAIYLQRIYTRFFTFGKASLLRMSNEKKK